MTNERRVLVHPDVDALIAAVAARFLTKLTDLLDEYTEVNVVLTGGTVGGGVQAAVAASPMRAAIDWTRVHFWWGDERFVPKDDPDRNEVQARKALLDALSTAEDHIHPFPASDEVADIDEAAARYADELRRHADPGLLLPVPRFDVLFLGVGPDGHIASLFPGNDLGRADGTTIAVRNSPKPPPERLSLTLPAINSAQRIWLVMSGAEKASALGLALAGASASEVPAAGAQGRRRTVFFVDERAAEQVPAALIAPEY